MTATSLFDQLGLSSITSLSFFQTTLLITSAATLLLINLSFFRLASILSRPRPNHRPLPSITPTHLLIVLGSGGHTAEMLNILSAISELHLAYTTRTYVCSSGDAFSAAKAAEFENRADGYNVITVRRARRVHQSILTVPFTSIFCLYDCLNLPQPDLILTNGPGTGVCVVLAATIRLFFGASHARTIFIESWARVKTLSLSGKILKPFVDRFIVQWPDLVKTEGGRVEYIGPLVS